MGGLTDHNERELRRVLDETLTEQCVLPTDLLRKLLRDVDRGRHAEQLLASYTGHVEVTAGVPG